LKKGHDFSSTFTNVDFDWDLPCHSVSLPKEKCPRLLEKLHSLIFKPSIPLNKKNVMSIHSSLQHITLVYQQGHSHLPPLTHFLSKFLNPHILHHIPSNVMTDLKWWSCTLVIPHSYHSLKPLPVLPIDIWVDASISVGVGVLVDSHWAAWQLLEGWDSDSQDIGWAEAVAIKLAVCG